MTLIISPDLNYTAKRLLRSSLAEAIKACEQGMHQCGTLCHKDAKLSDAAKEYFAKQLDEMEEAIEQLRGIKL